MPGWALARPLKENILAKITIRDNGPYLIEGDDVSVTDASGAEVPVERRPFALCRCGASANKPFCDGSHGRIGFVASSKAGS